MLQLIKMLLLVPCFLVALCSNALADQIDGSWCSLDGKSISVDGPQVTTPGGKNITANYNRHHVDFTIRMENQMPVTAFLPTR